ncbi:MAG: hypothetical protein IPN94_14540 [Sphingobacteriales bacterium]|nr:hypothetical protein [Sphingobacteriales bacterium]
MLSEDGKLSIITTNTISQTDTRITGLDEIVKFGTIIFAVKSMRWPGVANLEVALLSITKGSWGNLIVLKNKQVKSISTFLDEDESGSLPSKLISSSGICYVGTVVLGKGFILDKEQVNNILNSDKKYETVIFDYLCGSDVNGSPDLCPSRKIINFFDWNEEYVAKEFPLCYNVLKEAVKPERDILKRAVYRDNWWRYAERNPKLYKEIKSKSRILVVCRVTKYLSFQFVPKIMYTMLEQM